MKPETKAKAPAMSTPEEYTALGIPESWIEPLQKLGYTTIDKLKIGTISVDDVARCLVD